MRDFAHLFAGREDAHGFYYGLAGKMKSRGKRTSKAESLRDPVTPKLWQDHLTAKGLRLGIIPVMSDGRVNWACLDIDFYDIGDYQAKVAKAIRDAKLPLVQTKSKSGGAHLWLFFEQPIMAEWAQKIAYILLDRLDLPTVLGMSEEELKQHVDIFPKNFDPTDINLWMNMPYFGKECHCVGATGEEDLSLEEFVAYANERITAAELLDREAKKPVTKKGAERSPLPPCIDWMMQNKIGEGHRDMAMTHVAIVFKRAHGDTWQEKLDEFNEQHVEPPLRKDELRKIKRSVDAKDYEYMCDKVKTLYCDKGECKKRKYGVGQEPIDIPIEQIEKIDGENPTYIVKMDGRRVVVKPKQLYEFKQFREAAFAVLDRYLPMVKPADWEDIVSEHMQQMQVTAITDLDMRDRVIKAFQWWVGQGVVTTTFEEALAAKQAFYDGKAIIFNGDDFMTQIDRTLKCDRDKTFLYMRGWGVVQLEVNKKTYWCWLVNGPLWFDPTKKDQK
jgi:hypothetical protein